MSQVTEVESLPAKHPTVKELFINLAESLLVSLCEVFPECLNTQSVLQLYRHIIKGNDELEDCFIRKCSAVFKEHGDTLKNRQAEGLFIIAESIEHLKDIKLREKWEDPDFTNESREHLWQYMLKLHEYSQIYSIIPNKILTKLESTAHSFVDQLTQGSFDLNNLDLGKLGNELFSQMSPEEIANFDATLPEIFQSITSTTSGGVPAIPGLDIQTIFKQMASQCGESGATEGFDVSNLSSLLQGQLSEENNATVNLNQMMQTLAPFLQALQNNEVNSRKQTSKEKNNKKNKKKKG